MTTPQEKMKDMLTKTGIPFKDIDVYGSQIVITAFSREAADRWASLITDFAKLRGITKSIDENKRNEGTNLQPSITTVFRVFARI